MTTGRRPSRPPVAAPAAYDTFPTFYASSGRMRVAHGLRLQLDPDMVEEGELQRHGLRLVAGIDEVGRGCLAGPVVAGAVILPPGWTCAGLRDSKLLDAGERERLAAIIHADAIAWAVAAVEASVIDCINILQATLLASMLAAARLSVRPDALITDSLHLPDIGLPQRVLIDADRRCCSVAAASVVAKVYRDRLMVGYDTTYPGYGFAEHKGYAAPGHRAAIEELGLTPIHRRTFGTCIDAPLAEQIELWPDVEPSPIVGGS